MPSWKELKHSLGIERQVTTGASRDNPNMAGRHGIVTVPVTALAGEIRLGEAEFRSARAYHAGDTLAKGELVVVLHVHNAIALIEPVNRAALVPTSRRPRPIPVTEKGN